MHGPASSRSRFDEKLLDLSSKIDEFEGYSHSHALSIALIADAIGRQYNIAAHDRFFMQQAALLHDIGEMVMDREYIHASRTLTDEEKIDLHRHPVIGEQEASKRGFPKGVQLLIRWHHEWWNGGGYPDAIDGSHIPIGARILRVADTFASMTADRPFRKGLPVAEAKAFVKDWTGIEFDPAVVKAFLSIDETLYLTELPQMETPATDMFADEPNAPVEQTAETPESAPEPSHELDDDPVLDLFDEEGR